MRLVRAVPVLSGVKAGSEEDHEQPGGSFGIQATAPRENVMLRILRTLLPLALVATASFAAQAQQVSVHSLTGKSKVDITDLKREDAGMLMLRFSLTNISGADMDLSLSYGQVSLVDAVNRKKYLVVRDTAYNCLCSLSWGKLRTGETAKMWAKFPAPPESVRKVSLILPGFEPFDVPINR
jgi:hypothetical protein